MSKKKKLIVLVEDEQTLTNLIELGLKRAGYDVQTAGDGKTGLRLIEQSNPDLVLLDIVLPGLNGFDILERLYKKHILPGLPVIVISNSGQPVEIERVTKLGVRDYLIKVNFNPNEVIAKVNQAFESEKSQEQKKEAKGVKKKHEHRQVLVIEDDTILSDALERKFIEKEYAVHKAINAKEARRILQTRTVDAILLDLILPDVDGFTFLEEIKNDSRLVAIPIIIISNLGQKEEIEKGLKAGAADYIIKANTIPGKILEKVEYVLAKSRHERKK